MMRDRASSPVVGSHSPPSSMGALSGSCPGSREELVRQGHDVTLFASGDSITSAKLVPGAPQGLRLSGIKDHLASHLVMLSDVRRRETEFDIIHFHTDLLQYPIFEHMGYRTVTTMHGRLDLPDYMPAYRRFPDMPRVSISDAQRLPTPPNTNWVSTIYHGLPHDLCPFSAKGGNYLAFLGRISPEKRPDRAIEIAKRAGVPLKIAAKVDHVDTAYFEDRIKPMLDDPLIEFIGEINDREKAHFLANALALLFPIDWAEPFGLVMIEAMSAGTPVVAWRNGSVPEIITPGRSGFIVDSIAGAVAAVEGIGKARPPHRPPGVRPALHRRQDGGQISRHLREACRRGRGRSAGRTPCSTATHERTRHPRHPCR